MNMADQKPKPVFHPATLSDPPHVLPDDDFANPTMVTILVKLENGETAEFAIPRSLICGRSSYFKKAFLGGFAEAEKKTVTIEAPLWVFETFMRWLYTQRLYLRPSEQQSVPVLGSGKRKHGEDESEDSAQGDEKRPKVQQERPSESLQPTQAGSAAVQPVNKPESRNVVTFYGTDFVKPHDDGTLPEDAPNNPDEEDFSNPVTWPYDWLIDLYHFGDSHDTFGFRKLVLEFIQLKTQILVPRSYLPPDKEDTKHAVSKLPRSDRLFKYLAELWAKDISFANFDEYRDVADLVEEFPAQFITACFLYAKRQTQALKCRGEKCTRIDHVPSDQSGVFYQEECSFHEHASDADREACSKKWASIYKDWCMLENDAQEKEQEDDDK